MVDKNGNVAFWSGFRVGIGIEFARWELARETGRCAHREKFILLYIRELEAEITIEAVTIRAFL